METKWRMGGWRGGGEGNEHSPWRKNRKIRSSSSGIAGGDGAFPADGGGLDAAPRDADIHDGVMTRRRTGDRRGACACGRNQQHSLFIREIFIVNQDAAAAGSAFGVPDFRDGGVSGINAFIVKPERSRDDVERHGLHARSAECDLHDSFSFC